MAMPDQALLDEIIRRIVATVPAQRIILFGSAARGEMGEDSDLDFLVVVPDGLHRRKTAQAIIRCLMGVNVAKDIVVVTESDVHDRADDFSLVIYPALREGKELYRAVA